MGDIKLPDSELKVMDIIWENEKITAKDVAAQMEVQYGWKKTTTYTVLKNLQEKQVIERTDPGFICTPSVARKEVAKSALKGVLNNFYKGSPSALFSSFIEEKSITEEELDQIKEMIARTNLEK